MAFEQKPNTGSLFESKPGGKTDYNGRIVINEPGNYVMFGKKKKVGKEKQYNIIEISLMQERAQPAVVRPANTVEGDLPF